MLRKKIFMVVLIMIASMIATCCYIANVVMVGNAAVNFGFKLLNNIYGKEAFILKIDLPRTYFNQIRASTNLFNLLMIIIGIIFGVIIFHLFGKFVINPLSSLNKNVLQIGNCRDFSKRISTKGKGGISILSESINSMLDELQFLHKKTAENDITLRKQAEEALAAEKELFRVTFHSVEDAVITTDTDSNIVIINKTAEMFTGWKREEAVGKCLNDVFYIIDGKTRKCCDNPVQKVLDTGMVVELANNTILVARDGTERIITDTGAPIKDNNGNTLGAVLVFHDVTEKKHTEEEIRYLGFHDRLTGLYNRAFFEEELVRLNTKRQLPITLIIGGVNGLKLVNDAFGHNVGDRMLQKAAKILKSSCRVEDIVSRWGGDEFAIILPGTSEGAAREICERIIGTCRNGEKDPVQISMAFGSATKTEFTQDLYEVLKEAEDRMCRHKFLESQSVRGSIISSLEKALSERSFETEEHAKRLLNISMKIGQTIGLTDNELDELNLLCRFHDIGKIAVLDSIVMKPGPLSPEEWEQMKKHPEIGCRIIESSSGLAYISNYVLAHHERWDGTGYPHGLKGTQIPRLSRIIAVVDSYDVMTNIRPYKGVMTHEEAIEEIKRCSGTQFDPEIVQIFINIKF